MESAQKKTEGLRLRYLNLCQLSKTGWKLNRLQPVLSKALTLQMCEPEKTSVSTIYPIGDQFLAEIKAGDSSPSVPFNSSPLTEVNRFIPIDQLN